MKKGLLITFVFVAVMLGSGAFAYAPVISGVPDVVIGNAEDTAIDANFFRFSDAFVFDTKVNDPDTADDQLKWSYEVTGTGSILINGLGVDTNHALPTNDIRSGFTTASFLDTLASPGAPPFPTPTPLALSNLTVALYASDGVNVSAPVNINVKSLVGADSAGIVPFEVMDFATNAPNSNNGDYWAPFNGNFGDAETTMGYYDAANGGRLVITIPATFPGGNWYQWVQWNADRTGTKDVLTYQADSVYVVKTNISANRDTDVPQVRLRIGAQDFVWAQTHTIGGTSVADGAPALTGTDYLTILQPQGSTANAFMAIDYYKAQDLAAAEIYINTISLYRIGIPATDSTQATVTTMTELGAYPNIEGTPAITASGITMPNNATGYSAVGKMQALTTPCAVGDVYRVKYAVAQSGSGNVDYIRLRVNDSANSSYTSMMVLRDVSNTALIGTTPADFIVYHKTVNPRDVGTATDLALSFDTYVDAGADAQAVLSGIVVEKVTLPALN